MIYYSERCKFFHYLLFLTSTLYRFFYDFFQAVNGLPDPSGDKEGRSETDSQMSGSEDQKSNFDKDLTKVSKSSHSINKSKKSSSKKSRNR